MRKIYHKLYSDWSTKTQAQLRKYNLGEFGGMMYDSLSEDPNTFVMMDQGVVIGWALVNQSNWAMFFVRKGYRRQGIATKLVQRIKLCYDNIYVDGHDNMSYRFFEAVHLNTTIYDYNEQHQVVWV